MCMLVALWLSECAAFAGLQLDAPRRVNIYANRIYRQKERGEPNPRHLLDSCGCLLPHLTRLATLQCGEARGCYCNAKMGVTMFSFAAALRGCTQRRMAIRTSGKRSVL